MARSERPTIAGHGPPAPWAGPLDAGPWQASIADCRPPDRGACARV